MIPLRIDGQPRESSAGEAFESIDPWTRTAHDTDGSWVVHPAVITDVPSDARVLTDEVFGPLVVVTPFDTEDEAMRRANATRSG